MTVSAVDWRDVWAGRYEVDATFHAAVYGLRLHAVSPADDGTNACKCGLVGLNDVDADFHRAESVLGVIGYSAPAPVEGAPVVTVPATTTYFCTVCQESYVVPGADVKRCLACGSTAIEPITAQVTADPSVGDGSAPAAAMSA